MADLQVQEKFHATTPLTPLTAGNLYGIFQAVERGMTPCTASTTALRPTDRLYVGRMHFDTTLNKPIWRDKNNALWVDATGATV